MLQCSHDVLLYVLSHRDRGYQQLSVILETVEATSNGLASNFRDCSSLSLNPISCFVFIYFFTGRYVVSWPRYRKWKVPWMHRLDSLLRNDGMTEASDRFPLHCLQATQDKSACDSSVCVCVTIDASTCRNIALYTYFTWTQWTTQCWEKNMTILCLMFFDLWPVTSSKVGSWYFLSKVQNEFWGLIYVYNTVMCSIF